MNDRNLIALSKDTFVSVLRSFGGVNFRQFLKLNIAGQFIASAIVLSFPVAHATNQRPSVGNSGCLNDLPRQGDAPGMMPIFSSLKSNHQFSSSFGNSGKSSDCESEPFTEPELVNQESHTVSDSDGGRGGENVQNSGESQRQKALIDAIRDKSQAEHDFAALREEDLKCSIFDKDPFAQFESTLKEIRESMKLADCGGEKSDKDPIREHVDKISNSYEKVMEFKDAAKDLKLSDQGKIDELKKEVDSVITETLSLADSFKSNGSMRARCDQPTETSLKFAKNVVQLIDGLLPVANMAASKGISSPVLKSVVIGGNVVTQGISSVIDYMQSQKIDMSNAETRKALVIGVCQLVKTYTKRHYLVDSTNRAAFMQAVEDEVNPVEKEITSFIQNSSDDNNVNDPRVEKAKFYFKAIMLFQRYEREFDQLTTHLKGVDENSEKICFFGQSQFDGDPSAGGSLGRSSATPRTLPYRFLNDLKTFAPIISQKLNNGTFSAAVADLEELTQPLGVVVFPLPRNEKPESFQKCLAQTNDWMSSFRGLIDHVNLLLEEYHGTLLGLAESYTPLLGLIERSVVINRGRVEVANMNRALNTLLADDSESDSNNAFVRSESPDEKMNSLMYQIFIGKGVDVVTSVRDYAWALFNPGQRLAQNRSTPNSPLFAWIEHHMSRAHSARIAFQSQAVNVYDRILRENYENGTLERKRTEWLSRRHGGMPDPLDSENPIRLAGNPNDFARHIESLQVSGSTVPACKLLVPTLRTHLVAYDHYSAVSSMCRMIYPIVEPANSDDFTIIRYCYDKARISDGTVTEQSDFNKATSEYLARDRKYAVALFKKIEELGCIGGR